MTRSSSIARFLTTDHEHCDNLFADAENAASRGDWAQAEARFHAFRRDTLRHFEREESVCFPAFEDHTGMRGGPTFVMRAEHGQMRDMLTAMGQALAAKNQASYLGLAETLLMLMRQHNLKEESILYPMLDQALAAEAQTLIVDMSAPALAEGG